MKCQVYVLLGKNFPLSINNQMNYYDQGSGCLASSSAKMMRAWEWV